MNRVKEFFTMMSSPNCIADDSSVSPSRELVDDTHIKWATDLAGHGLTIESVCNGYRSDQHRFVKPPNEPYDCSLCLDKWISNKRIFTQCKNCEFSICEKCYEKEVLPYA